MLDSKLRPWIDPPLNAAGRQLARLGIGPNLVTLSGLLVGIAGAVAISYDAFALGLALILANRILDGLDGAVARATRASDFGGYLDIVSDFAFYVAVPIGFALADPRNLFPALLLVASFTLTGISFLAFATLAAKRGLETNAHGKKSLFYNTGLAEGTETIIVFVLLCVWPVYFGLIATGYAVLCGITVLQRSGAAYATFSPKDDDAK